jgi:hypothetical protein
VPTWISTPHSAHHWSMPVSSSHWSGWPTCRSPVPTGDGGEGAGVGGRPDLLAGRRAEGGLVDHLVVGPAVWAAGLLDPGDRHRPAHDCPSLPAWRASSAA